MQALLPFPAPTPVRRRACSQAREEIFALVLVGADGENEVFPWNYTNSFLINALVLSPYLKTKQKQNRNKKGDKSNKGNFIGNERELHQLLEIKGTPFQSISSVPTAHPPPGHLSSCRSRRWGICQNASARGWGICQFF